MKKMLCIVFAAMVVATGVSIAKADQTLAYSWEEDPCQYSFKPIDELDYPWLGQFTDYNDNLTVVPPAIVDPNMGAVDGSKCLRFTEAPHVGTPRVHVAYITGLVHGDVVTASFWGYDDVAGEDPSLRIWSSYARYDSATDTFGYAGSYKGEQNLDYTDGTGWSQLQHTYTFDEGSPVRETLVIEARCYSTPATDPAGSTDYFVDLIKVTAPDHATIYLPGPAFPAAPHGIEPGCYNQPASDITGDCQVDLSDFAVLASEWLTCGLEPITDCWQ